MRDGITRSAAEAYADCGCTYPPNPMQEEMYELVTQGDSTLLLKAGTGTGKMEAVVVPAVTHERRLVLIYPALSLIEDQEERLEKLLAHLSTRIVHRPLSLVVDTGAAMYRRTWKEGKERAKQRRHLYHGDIILTTIDKFLYRFFSFGEPKKSYIYPLRLRYGRQPIYCFDEAHSYDGIAYTNFVDLIQAIGFNVDAPRDVVVMTATMPSSYEQELLPFLTPIDYTVGERLRALNAYYASHKHAHPEKAFSYLPVPIEDKEHLLQELLSCCKTHVQAEQRTIIIVETVETAIALYRLLCTEPWEPVLLYHGRQPHPLRRRIYATLKQREKEKKSYVLITTSAIEVGCDLDAHLLITQLCNPEQLIQRAGRCNRRGDMADAHIIVIGKGIPEYLSTLASSQEEEQYRSLLHVMADHHRFVAADCMTFRRKPIVSDYRVQTMFRMLYEYVYQAEQVNRPLHEKGLVVTRSWEPTITLTTGWNERDELQHELQISLLRCVANHPSQIDPQCELFLRSYDEQEGRYKLEPPNRGGCAYHQDLLIRVPASYMDEVCGYERLPKVFLRAGSRAGYRRQLMAFINQPVQDPPSPPKKGARSQEKGASSTQKKVWWWYLDRLPSFEESLQSDELEETESREEEKSDLV